MKKEPIRHHYIPQFIIKNFSYDDNKRYVHYYDMKSQEVKDLLTTKVFMEKNLYRDEINNPEEPTTIESDFAKFEAEAAHILKSFLSNMEIDLSVEDDKKLKLFFALMGFRSSRVRSDFIAMQTDSNNNDFYQKYQPNGDFEDFWKRNLSYLVNCRSIDEVVKHPNIDEPIKIFMRRDTIGVSGMYFIVCERRGSQDFVLSDTYPVVITGDLFKIHMYSYFPISPSRIIILASNGVENSPKNIRIFNDDILKQPKLSNDRKTYKFNVHKIYESTVDKINEEIMNNAERGFIFKDYNNVVFND
jgi:hypothetical protein